MALSHLKALQALELALRLGSLQAAGSALWITPAAVGQKSRLSRNTWGWTWLCAEGRDCAPLLSYRVRSSTYGLRSRSWMPFRQC